MQYRKFFSLLLGALLFTSLSVQAQKIAYVNVQEILESIEEYQEAQTELDRMANTWRQEIAQEYDNIKSLYNRYQAEQVLLSEDIRAQREQEIMDKEKQVRDLQRARFGPEGQLFKRRQELVRPIQEKVYAAIETFAQERDYDFIFDRSSDSSMIFTNPDYDKTQDVLRRL